MSHLHCQVDFFQSGHCSQFARLTGVKSWKWIRFYAVFAAVRHPKYGLSLIDTGYSPVIWDVTRRLPHRAFRWLLPIKLDAMLSPAPILACHGIPIDDVQRIFVSHFHADHIGGLRDFPKAKMIYRNTGLEGLLTLTPWQQLHQGFFPGLLPDDFQSRGETLNESQLVAGAMQGMGLAPEFNAFHAVDYFQDGSLWIVDLPGHAVGHTGYLIRAETGWIFFIVDACWNVNVLMKEGRLPKFSHRAVYDMAAYDQSQNHLRRLAHGAEDVRLIACHCPLTQAFVKNMPRR
jgi:glyoxylase-like metal-dependent hydrolase (beta-lactamase superfamily II)